MTFLDTLKKRETGDLDLRRRHRVSFGIYITLRRLQKNQSPQGVDLYLTRTKFQFSLDYMRLKGELESQSVGDESASRLSTSVICSMHRQRYCLGQYCEVGSGEKFNVCA
jgi:hypothetical protein